MQSDMLARPATSNPQQREAFYARLEPHSMAPLWTRVTSPDVVRQLGSYWLLLNEVPTPGNHT